MNKDRVPSVHFLGARKVAEVDRFGLDVEFAASRGLDLLPSCMALLQTAGESACDGDVYNVVPRKMRARIFDGWDDAIRCR